MNQFPDFPAAPLDLTVRIGCKLRYETAFATSMLLNIKPRQDSYQLVTQEALDIAPIIATSEFQDEHGNAVLRLDLEPGTTTLIYDAIARVPSLSEDFLHDTYADHGHEGQCANAAGSTAGRLAALHTAVTLLR